MDVSADCAVAEVDFEGEGCFGDGHCELDVVAVAGCCEGFGFRYHGWRVGLVGEFLMDVLRPEKVEGWEKCMLYHGQVLKKKIHGRGCHYLGISYSESYLQRWM